eukprot:14414995-Ditylum_brightwellii.AAC.1
MDVDKEGNECEKSGSKPKDKTEKNTTTSKNSSSSGQQTGNQKGQSQSSANNSRQNNANDRNRHHRNRKKVERPPAIKLHIGNLSYTTVPDDLFDFFANIFGRENVLECHIPTERDTGKSRGFGFVTMPETAALQALNSGRPHEMDGRILKVAESNSAGAGKPNQNARGGAPSDRCATCGYRPRYCTCS